MEYDPVSEQELLREMRHVRRALKRRRLLWGLLICVIIMVAAGWFVFNRYLVLASVPTTAMEGTVAGNSVVLCLRREAGKAPRVGDVILFNQGETTRLKRVAAQSGDQIMQSRNGALWINGKPFDEGNTALGAAGDLLYHPMTVPEGELFVLGDQYQLSVDSRSAAFGTVKEEQIMGTLITPVWPPYQLADPFMQYVWKPVNDAVVQPVVRLFR